MHAPYCWLQITPRTPNIVDKKNLRQKCVNLKYKTEKFKDSQQQQLKVPNVVMFVRFNKVNKK